jgi:hypothetical protein
MVTLKDRYGEFLTDNRDEAPITTSTQPIGLEDSDGSDLLQNDGRSPVHETLRIHR